MLQCKIEGGGPSRPPPYSRLTIANLRQAGVRAEVLSWGSKRIQPKEHDHETGICRARDDLARGEDRARTSQVAVCASRAARLGEACRRPRGAGQKYRTAPSCYAQRCNPPGSRILA